MKELTDGMKYKRERERERERRKPLETRSQKKLNEEKGID